MMFAQGAGLVDGEKYCGPPKMQHILHHKQTRCIYFLHLPHPTPSLVALPLCQCWDMGSAADLNCRGLPEAKFRIILVCSLSEIALLYCVIIWSFINTMDSVASVSYRLENKLLCYNVNDNTG